MQSVLRLKMIEVDFLKAMMQQVSWASVVSLATPPLRLNCNRFRMFFRL